MKSRTTKKTSIIFLIIALVFGIFTAIFPLFITEVEAQPPIPIVGIPSDIAYDSDKQRMYVATMDLNVYVIDTTTNNVIGKIPIGNGPGSIAYDDANMRIYVTNQGDNTVSVIDTNTSKVLATIPVGDGPRDIAFDQLKRRMYVSNFGNDTISIIDTNTNNLVSSPIKVGDKPSGIVYAQANKFGISIINNMYVANSGDGTVYVIKLW